MRRRRGKRLGKKAGSLEIGDEGKREGDLNLPCLQMLHQNPTGHTKFKKNSNNKYHRAGGVLYFVCFFKAEEISNMTPAHDPEQ